VIVSDWTFAVNRRCSKRTSRTRNYENQSVKLSVLLSTLIDECKGGSHIMYV